MESFIQLSYSGASDVKWAHVVAFVFLSVLLGEQNVAVASALRSQSASEERPICLYHLSDKVNSPDNLSGGDQLLEDGTVLCDAPSDYCFSYWQIEPYNESDSRIKAVAADSPGFKLLAKGCFKNAHSCLQKSCVAKEKEIENSFFCCCKGNRCNEDMRFEEQPSTPGTGEEEAVVDGTPVTQLSKAMLIVLACVTFMCVVGVSVCCFLVHRRGKKKKALANSSIGFNKSPSSPCIDLNNLKFLGEIGQGRYGTVYKALLRDEEVAVKLFSRHQRLSFCNEKYIYSLPLMEHTNLLSFFGGGEIVGPDSCLHLGLVLSYCSRGKLSAYLQENTLDWPTFCRIAITAVRGLAHLHSYVRKGDLMKPCVAHRDFNTRNILLKEDMSCVVSDLGFAIHTQEAKFYQNGEEQIAEMASLTDVGTLRYMAPEVLEGAVNLRDCETSLKQIDIYALGLVLWEIACRCHDLYQGTPTPHYALPFEAEIGLRPSFEQLQVLVARNKARPLFPQIWKDSAPHMKELKETIKDCWDNDAEARLSAMCVERRLTELPKLWGRYKASLGLNSISPTPNVTSGKFLNSNEFKSFLISNELSLQKDKDVLSHRESSVSENTVETTIPFSPSDHSGRVLGKNHLLEAVNGPPLPRIQPHQGRNPCLERNTINEHSKEPHHPHNDDFVKASEKYPHSNLELGLNSATLLEALESRHGIDPQIMSEHLVPLLSNIFPIAPQAPLPEVNSPPHVVPYPNHVPPIPYVQNEMRPVEGRPKLQNAARERGRRSGWRHFWSNAWEASRLGKVLPLGRQSRQREYSSSMAEERRGILTTPTSNNSEPPTPLSPLDAERGFHQTHVLLANGAPHTVISAPNNRPVLSHEVDPPLPQTLPQSPVLPPCIAETEIGIAKLHLPPSLSLGLTPIVRSRPGSKDSGINKSSENSNNSFLDSDSSLERARRPTTLQLQGGRTNKHLAALVVTSEEELPSHGDNDVQIKLRKPKQRVKTPRRPALPRLSLYDDSVMCGGALQDSPDLSLSRSLPLAMNTMGQGTQASKTQVVQGGGRENGVCKTAAPQ